MQATLNGYDIKETFGLVITAGMDAFLDFGAAKETTEHDFPEVDGMDKDLPGVKFEAREFVITFTLKAAGIDDFKTKYWGLRTALKSPGLKELYYADHDETYYVYYKKQENRKQLTRSIGSSDVGLQFDLVFGETDPGANIEDVNIITENDEYLIA